MSTPRVDELAHVKLFGTTDLPAAYRLLVNLARQLETELQAARERVQELEVACANNFADLVNAMARAEVAETALEHERMKVAGCSTASFGSWKEGDPLSPDYECAAIHDVARLYQKYIIAAEKERQFD